MNRWCVSNFAQWLVAILLAITIVGQPRAQQQSTGEIRGHVTDAMGAAISKAAVFVHRTDSSEEIVRLAIHTDREGNFDLVLPEGGYDVLITSRGFASVLEVIPVWHGKTKSVTWKLKPLGCDFPNMICDTFQ
jgi:hypothetical protein